MASDLETVWEPFGVYMGTRKELREAHRSLARAELMHRRTADHLRRERKRRRFAEAQRDALETIVSSWEGCEDVASILTTPEHYRGDGYVTCRRAMQSAASQATVAPRSEVAFYWWMSAMKYVWRMWSKQDPEGDARKAIDCLRKAMREA